MEKILMKKSVEEGLNIPSLGNTEDLNIPNLNISSDILSKEQQKKGFERIKQIHQKDPLQYAEFLHNKELQGNMRQRYGDEIIDKYLEDMKTPGRADMGKKKPKYLSLSERTEKLSKKTPVTDTKQLSFGKSQGGLFEEEEPKKILAMPKTGTFKKQAELNLELPKTTPKVEAPKIEPTTPEEKFKQLHPQIQKDYRIHKEKYKNGEGGESEKYVTAVGRYLFGKEDSDFKPLTKEQMHKEIGHTGDNPIEIKDGKYQDKANSLFGETMNKDLHSYDTAEEFKNNPKPEHKTIHQNIMNLHTDDKGNFDKNKYRETFNNTIGRYGKHSDKYNFNDDTMHRMDTKKMLEHEKENHDGPSYGHVTDWKKEWKDILDGVHPDYKGITNADNFVKAVKNTDQNYYKEHTFDKDNLEIPGDLFNHLQRFKADANYKDINKGNKPSDWKLWDKGRWDEDKLKAFYKNPTSTNRRSEEDFYKEDFDSDIMDKIKSDVKDGIISKDTAKALLKKDKEKLQNDTRFDKHTRPIHTKYTTKYNKGDTFTYNGLEHTVTDDHAIHNTDGTKQSTGHFYSVLGADGIPRELPKADVENIKRVKPEIDIHSKEFMDILRGRAKDPANDQNTVGEVPDDVREHMSKLGISDGGLTHEKMYDPDKDDQQHIWNYISFENRGSKKGNKKGKENLLAQDSVIGNTAEYISDIADGKKMSRYEVEKLMRQQPEKTEGHEELKKQQQEQGINKKEANYQSFRNKYESIMKPQIDEDKVKDIPEYQKYLESKGKSFGDIMSEKYPEEKASHTQSRLDRMKMLHDYYTENYPNEYSEFTTARGNNKYTGGAPELQDAMNSHLNKKGIKVGFIDSKYNKWLKERAGDNFQHLLPSADTSFEEHAKNKFAKEANNYNQKSFAEYLQENYPQKYRELKKRGLVKDIFSDELLNAIHPGRNATYEHTKEKFHKDNLTPLHHLALNTPTVEEFEKKVKETPEIFNLIKDRLMSKGEHQGKTYKELGIKEAELARHPLRKEYSEIVEPLLEDYKGKVDKGQNILNYDKNLTPKDLTPEDYLNKKHGVYYNYKEKHPIPELVEKFKNGELDYRQLKNEIRKLPPSISGNMYPTDLLEKMNGEFELPNSNPSGASPALLPTSKRTEHARALLEQYNKLPDDEKHSHNSRVSSEFRPAKQYGGEEGKIVVLDHPGKEGTPVSVEGKIGEWGLPSKKTKTINIPPGDEKYYPQGIQKDTELPRLSILDALRAADRKGENIPENISNEHIKKYNRLKELEQQLEPLNQKFADYHTALNEYEPFNYKEFHEKANKNKESYQDEMRNLYAGKGLNEQLPLHGINENSIMAFLEPEKELSVNDIARRMGVTDKEQEGDFIMQGEKNDYVKQRIKNALVSAYKKGMINLKERQNKLKASIPETSKELRDYEKSLFYLPKRKENMNKIQTHANNFFKGMEVDKILDKGLDYEKSYYQRTQNLFHCLSTANNIEPWNSSFEKALNRLENNAIELSMYNCKRNELAGEEVENQINYRPNKFLSFFKSQEKKKTTVREFITKAYDNKLDNDYYRQDIEYINRINDFKNLIAYGQVDLNFEKSILSKAKTTLNNCILYFNATDPNCMAMEETRSAKCFVEDCLTIIEEKQNGK